MEHGVFEEIFRLRPKSTINKGSLGQCLIRTFFTVNMWRRKGHAWGGSIFIKPCRCYGVQKEVYYDQEHSLGKKAVEGVYVSSLNDRTALTRRSWAG